MKTTRWMQGVLLPLLLGALTAVASAQGKGQGKGKGGNEHGKGKGNDKSEVVRLDVDRQARGKHGSDRVARADDKDDDRGRGGRKDKNKSVRGPVIIESAGNVTFREFAVSPRRGKRLAGLAVASAARFGPHDDFILLPVGSRVQVLNRNRAVLVDFDDDEELGNWKVVSTPFKEKKGAPSFCRSGAGHPVWGRQWCLDKGFGLGSDNDIRWSRVLDPSNVTIRQRTTSDLTRDVLLDVLGSVVVNRIATHAVTLGYQDPLHGRWLGDTNASGPRVLLISSGTRPVAEVVDVNRDGTADLMLVSVRR